jgi:hypothetical protein
MDEPNLEAEALLLEKAKQGDREAFWELAARR